MMAGVSYSIIHLELKIFQHLLDTDVPDSHLNRLTSSVFCVSLSLHALWCYFPAVESLVDLAQLHSVKHELRA